MNKIEKYNLLLARVKRLNDKKVLTLDAMREIWDSLTDVEKQELDNQRYMVENNMFRTHGDVQISIAELFSQDLHTDELVDKEFSEEAISNLIELSKDETYLKDLNEQLKQLISQYERENPEDLARNAYYCLPTNKYIEFYTDKFIKWQLASRQTCTPNERAFLDEIRENFKYSPGSGTIFRGDVILYPSNFPGINLKELVNDN